MAPVRSVAIPTLIGAAAAFAQAGWTDQLLTPVAIAPLIEATLRRNRLRPIIGEVHLSFVFSRIVHVLLSAISPPGWNFPEDDGNHENQDVGQHGRHRPG